MMNHFNSRTCEPIPVCGVPKVCGVLVSDYNTVTYTPHTPKVRSVRAAMCGVIENYTQLETIQRLNAAQNVAQCKKRCAAWN